MRAHEGPLVLVVEDYDDTRALVVQVLVEHGCRTAEATSGEEAVARAISLLPSVVLMDIGLPGMDGEAATRELKADERTAHVPVIAVTAFSDRWNRADPAPFTRVVPKPCSPATLVAAVDEALGRVLSET